MPTVATALRRLSGTVRSNRHPTCRITRRPLGWIHPTPDISPGARPLVYCAHHAAPRLDATPGHLGSGAGEQFSILKSRGDDLGCGPQVAGPGRIMVRGPLSSRLRVARLLADVHCATVSEHCRDSL